MSCQVDTRTPSRRHFYNLTGCLLHLLLLAACAPTPAAATATVALPAPEQTTPTAAPAAAIVNGEEISRPIYDIHLDQYQAAQQQTGTLLASENAEQIVLDDLIDRLLLAQGARAEGYILDEATVDQRLSSVVEQAGGQEAFDQWLAAQRYTAEEFRAELRLEIEAGWMRAKITDAVPTSAEQVEARQILLLDSFSAERLLSQLQGGTPFEQVARNNDPQGLGYLGWFPRGTLLQSEVEEAAFALQPGEFSDIVETSLGFHLVEVLDRDPDRPLSPQARLALQLQALQDWLAQQRAQAVIENFLP